MGMQEAIFANFTVTSDANMGANGRPFADFCPLVNNGIGADGDVRGYLNRRMDYGCRVNALKGRFSVIDVEKPFNGFLKRSRGLITDKIVFTWRKIRLRVYANGASLTLSHGFNVTGIR